MADLSRWDIQNPRVDFDRSEETLAFETMITRDGKPVLLASNDGRGGGNYYGPVDPSVSAQEERQAKQELRNDVAAVVQGISDHPSLQFEVVDIWVVWKLTGEPKGISFEDTVRGIAEQLHAGEEPLEDGVIESILEARIQEQKEYVFVVLDIDGRVVDTFDSEQDADDYVAERGGKLKTGLSIWQKEKTSGLMSRINTGDIIDPQYADLYGETDITQRRSPGVFPNVAFGGLSDPSKMPCKSISYPAGGKVTCPRGSKLMKYPGTVCYFCYGADGLYVTPIVQLAQDRRFNLLAYAKKFSPRREAWITSLVNEIGRMKWFRWHETGDIQDETHWLMMLQVILRTPHTNHWIPTKEQQFIESWIDEVGEHAVPDKLNIRVSAGYIGNRAEVKYPNVMTTSSVSDPEAGDMVSKPGYRCVATWKHEETGGKCESSYKSCRACWLRQVKNVDYKLHVGTRQAKKRAHYLSQRAMGRRRGDIEPFTG